jgi:prepilin-type N-terminal cleavage/methylation domain-containing protein
MVNRILKSGFTLIELLIVVAIIAILAAIAVPNFLEAQVRAKISRAKADMRTVHTGLEMYRIDTNNIPFMNGINSAIDPDDKAGSGTYLRTLERLTSPVAYLTGRGTFADPFPARVARRLGGAETPAGSNIYTQKAYAEYFYAVRGKNFASTNNGEHLQWGDQGKAQWALLQSSGPQLKKWWFGTEVNTYLASDNNNTRGVCNDMIYNATNGTVSAGTILRVIGSPAGRGSVLGKVAMEGQNNKS